jgi:hypothetical protein
MAILIEAYNIVLKDVVLDREPNLRQAFLENIPSNAYCFDGVIHRIGFMDPQFMGQYIYYLENYLGLTYLDENKEAKDFVVVEMRQGLEAPCKWLVVKRDSYFENMPQYKNHKEIFVIAWHVDHKNGIPEKFGCLLPKEVDPNLIFSFNTVAFPYGWNPDNAILLSMSHHPDDLEEIERLENGVIVYRNKKSGELVYVGSGN